MLSLHKLLVSLVKHITDKLVFHLTHFSRIAIHQSAESSVSLSNSVLRREILRIFSLRFRDLGQDITKNIF
jgi:hypothetical protein